MSTRELPGPAGWRLIETFASLLQGDLLKPFVRLFEGYGPLFRIPLPLGQDLVMLAHPDADQTLLGAYMAARDPESGEGMSDRQLRDDAVTLYLAGHETTASLLTWALYWLARRPGIAERVTAEIDRHIVNDNPCSDDLKALEYTARFVNEVLRLYPPAWTIARNAVSEDVILGYRIPAGAIVMLSPYLAHRWEEIWPDPLRFDPDRFTPEAIKGRHPFAYFPFSLGPRICIGMQFSLLEDRLVLALILRRFNVEPLDEPEIGCVAAGTLRPAQTIWIRLARRD